MTTKPRASTLENAVVGVGGAPRPIKDLVRPCARNVDTRGVADEGKGTPTFDVKVIAEGVLVGMPEEASGDGGNTKSVWEGVKRTFGEAEVDRLWVREACFTMLLRKCNGGGAGLDFFESVR